MAEPPVSLMGGRIQRGALLGQGGVARVYRAVDRHRRGAVALKIIDGTGMAETSGTPLRFAAEARAQAELDHPHLVPVYDAGREGPWHWYTMELLDGSVRDALGGAIHAETAARWVFETLAALDVVHRAGLVHRDIKPGNLLLTRERVVKLGDFGIARHPPSKVRYRTLSGSGMGSRGYAAPELTSDAAAVDARADLYGAAAVLFELLTGQPPGRLALVDLDVEVLEAVPEPYRAIVARAVAPSPDARYPTAHHMAAALCEAAGHPEWLDELEPSTTLLTKLRRLARVLSRGPSR